LQEDIAREISNKLRLQLSREEQKQLAKRGTQNPDAYQDYLRGRYHSNKRRPKDVERGIEYFKQAIDKDPNYAQAYSGLADSYYFQAVYVGRTINEFYQRELLAAQRALELDDTLAEAHTSMGQIKGSHDWDWATGEEHFKRAIELNSNYAQAHISYGTQLARQGRLKEGIAEVKKVLELDPVSPSANSQLARLLVYDRQFDEVIGLQTIFEETGGSSLYWLSLAYWWKGMHEEAIEWAEKRTPVLSNSHDPFPVFLRQLATDNRADAMRTIEDWKRLTPHWRAYYYAWLGEKDLAIEWLTKAIDERYHGVAFTNVNPTYDPLRSDPRFQELLRRMNLAP